VNYNFKQELTNTELERIIRFYNSLSNVTLEQHPLWNSTIKGFSQVNFFWSEENGKINTFCVIEEKKFFFIKGAYIHFGPLFRHTEPDLLIDSILEIREYYKKRGFSHLYIQLAFPTGSLSDYIEYKINKKIKIEYNFDKNNWSSLTVNLLPPFQEIEKSFSKGHRSSIKKAFKDGLTVKPVNTAEDISSFCQVYKKMESHRNIDSNCDLDFFNHLFQFLEEYNKGFGLIVQDKDFSTVGGIIVLTQGHTARYYKGASDPERKELPILHVAVLEAIKIAKEKGLSYLDLWGYNHFATSEDQIFYINRFKKGFSTDYIFYPKKMYIILNKVTHSTYKLALKNKKVFKSILGNSGF
jgi:hypothetical protein